jgi:toxin FitB
VVNYLLDTNVVSELTKPRPNPNVEAWFRTTPATDLHLSVITLGEIRKGIELRRGVGPRDAERFESWLDALLLQYRTRIVAFDEAAADRWGRLMAADRNLPVEDGQIAAMALVRDMTLVTRNARHLATTGVPLLNHF